MREAIATMFDFEWTNKNLCLRAATRATARFFGNSELAATGLPSPEELKILEPLRGKIPDEVFTTGVQAAGDRRHAATSATGARRAIALLKEAGWEIKDGKMTEQGRASRSPSRCCWASRGFERIALPFKQNLRAHRHRDERAHRRHRAVSERARTSFDFDMMTDVFGQSLSPGNEQRDFWGSEAGRHQGQPQHHRHHGPGDRQADRAGDRRTRPREPDHAHARARPRAAVAPLRGAATGTATRPGSPTGTSSAGRRSSPNTSRAAFDTWWIDAAKEKALRRPDRRQAMIGRRR